MNWILQDIKVYQSYLEKNQKEQADSEKGVTEPLTDQLAHQQPADKDTKAQTDSIQVTSANGDIPVRRLLCAP